MEGQSLIDVKTSFGFNGENQFQIHWLAFLIRCQCTV